MSDEAPRSEIRQWDVGGDLLVLFTDGITDARNREGVRLGEEPVLDCVMLHRHEEPDQIASRVFTLLDHYTADTPTRDDLTLVILKS